MGRYQTPKCKLCRREAQKLFLRGTRCYTEKCALERRKIGERVLLPGQHGAKSQRVSDYRIRLREKQKLRRIYGIGEEQFKNYFKKAQSQSGVTGHNLLVLLERRLDNVIYKAGFAKSISDARQLVIHNHIRVNNKKVNIPSFLVRVNDEVTIKDKSKDLVRIKEALSMEVNSPDWLEVDKEQLKIKVGRLPTRQDIQVPVNEQLVVEFYSR